MGKLLLIAGLVIAAVGLLMMMGLPRLPGDIAWRRGNATFYFPIVTSIILSVLLSLVLYILNR